MSEFNFEPGLEFAKRLDQKDPLGKFREEFIHPTHSSSDGSSKDVIYFVGNSLGLQPKKARAYCEEVLEDWGRFGVRGHLESQSPWYSYHEFLTESTARLVGAIPSEVVVMNTLTVNLHLMLVSFYRPTSERFKILIEKGAFPSDQYAVDSQVRFHGFDPREAVIEIGPREGEETLRPEDLLSRIDHEGDEIALILLGNVNFRTGQAFDIKAVTKAGHRQGCKVGFDLAHGAGNLTLDLHSDGPDFAVWCTYKYLNSGPGGLSGCFVHERHQQFKGPRFEGWWGHHKKDRFKMARNFHPIPGAEGWQLSNPPILSLATLRASMELFDQAGRSKLADKRNHLTSYLEYRLQELGSKAIHILTPSDPHQRGSQLSLRIQNAKGLEEQLLREGIYCDFREPDILRVAPVPLYNRYEDVHHFAERLKQHVS